MTDFYQDHLRPIQKVYVDIGTSSIPLEPTISSESVPGIVGFSLSQLIHMANAAENPDAMIYFQTALPVADQNVHSFADGRIVVNSKEHVLLVDNVEVEVTPKTFNIIELLAQKPGIVTTFADISEINGWQSDHYGTNLIGLYVGYARRALGPELGSTDDGAIKTVKRVGYKALKSVA